MTVQSKVIRIYKTGNSTVLKQEKIILKNPLADEIRIRHYAIGLNFIDINMRNGNYSINEYSQNITFPYILGVEGAGEVVYVGKYVYDFQLGDRVTHCMNLGAYSEFMNVKADKVISIPNNISYEIAAASTLKGLTAHYLINELWKVKKNSTVAIHSAAGGVGSILCQWANFLGAKVIGIVSSNEKINYIKNIGAHFGINSKKQDFSAEINKITNGKGANVIYDSVGKGTIQKGLNALSQRGRLISYGNSAGPIDLVDISKLKPLAASIACGGLLTFIKDKDKRNKNAKQLFNLISEGDLKIDIFKRYQFNEVATAHEKIESRSSIGSNIIIT